MVSDQSQGGRWSANSMLRKRSALLIVAILFCGVSVIWVSNSEDPLPADKLLSSLNSQNRELRPEVFEPTEWTFWCTGGDPGVLSGGTEFIAAREFAAKNNLLFNGPNQRTSETVNYNLLFVRDDGSFSEKKLSRFSFEWNFGDKDCWRRFESTIRFIENGRLRVESKNG